MKTFRLMITFVFVAIATTTGVLGDGTDAVFCEEGEPLRTNVPYYISFMTSDYNMWITRMNYASHTSTYCPQQPVMFTRPTMPATPVIFQLKSTPASNVTINESTELYIKFVDPNPCGQSGYWRVARASSTSDGEVLLNGSYLGSDSAFTIHMTNEFYKFAIGPYNDPNVYPVSISMTNNAVYNKVLAKKLSGEMEILFHKTKPY